MHFINAEAERSGTLLFSDIQMIMSGIRPLSRGDKRGNVLGLLRIREGEAYD